MRALPGNFIYHLLSFGCFAVVHTRLMQLFGFRVIYHLSYVRFQPTSFSVSRCLFLRKGAPPSGVGGVALLVEAFARARIRAGHVR